MVYNSKIKVLTTYLITLTGYIAKNRRTKMSVGVYTSIFYLWPCRIRQMAFIFTLPFRALFWRIYFSKTHFNDWIDSIYTQLMKQRTEIRQIFLIRRH